MLRWDTQDTICAIASGNQGAFRGAIRISGPRALEVAGAMLPEAYREAHWDNWRSIRRATRMEAELELGETLGRIPCDFWIWPNSQSYTGQPSVELHLFGSMPLLESCVQRLCTFGARLAEAGEFTFRAFLAGRMDLAQCEAVLGVIDAKSQKGLDIALEQLAGGLQLPLQSLRQKLIELLADLEAGLDFVDEDIEFVTQDSLKEQLRSSLDAMQPIVQQLGMRGFSDAWIKVALFGLPNAGKSSLINALAGYQAALVSDIPGTTRDYVKVRSERHPIQWIDTAGKEDVHEQGPRQEAQERTNEQWEQADLRWWCVDLSQEPIADAILPSPALTASTNDQDLWLVGTKADLAPQDLLQRWQAWAVPTGKRFFVSSSQSRYGLESLEQALDEWLVDRDAEASGILPSTLSRCRTALEAAQRSIECALQAVEDRAGDEIVAAELRLALDHLGVIVGEVYTDDILDALFSRFCIGK